VCEFEFELPHIFHSSYSRVFVFFTITFFVEAGDLGVRGAFAGALALAALTAAGGLAARALAAGALAAGLGVSSG